MILTQAQIAEVYGRPGDTTQHVVLQLPYSFLLDWDLTQSVKRIICHKLIKDRLEKVFKDTLEYYGQQRITELGIDQYGGCFIHRPQRGYENNYMAAIERNDHAGAIKYLSKHSWAVALDFDPNRNKLTETSKTARFARAEYAPWIEIWYDNGFLSYGREKNYDWMHFEIATLKP